MTTKNKIIVSMSLVVSYVSSHTIDLKKHEQWWQQKCVEVEKHNTFNGWVGSQDADTRFYIRENIIRNGYQSVLDIPCGLCVDYPLLKKACPKINYLGIDITPLFVQENTAKGNPCRWGRIQEIPCEDSSFDVVYSRHILEHLDSYEVAIKELVRVAKKEVMIVFFIAPHEGTPDLEIIADVDGYPIYHNRYNKSKIDTYLRTLPKIKYYFWQNVGRAGECVLHIFV